jgi:preprotein translocase subunit SecA
VEDPADMFAPLLKKLFGSKNEREVKRMLKTVQLVNAFEEQMVALSDEQLRAKTEEFKARIAKGKPSTSCCPKPSRSPVKPASASWACATSTSS